MIFLILLGGVLIVIALYLWAISDKVWPPLSILLTVIAIFLFGAACYVGSSVKIGQLDAFANATLDVYSGAATETTELISLQKDLVEKALIPVEGSVEKFGLGQEAADRLKEMRDEISKYNSEVARLQRMDHTPFVGLFYANADSLKLITWR